MAMNNTTWGDAVADAIQSIGIVAGPPITLTQLKTVWRAIKGEDITHLVANAEVSDVATTGTITSGSQIGETTASTGAGSITS